MSLDKILIVGEAELSDKLENVRLDRVGPEGLKDLSEDYELIVLKPGIEQVDLILAHFTGENVSGLIGKGMLDDVRSKYPEANVLYVTEQPGHVHSSVIRDLKTKLVLPRNLIKELSTNVEVKPEILEEVNEKTLQKLEHGPIYNFMLTYRRIRKHSWGSFDIKAAKEDSKLVLLPYDRDVCSGKDLRALVQEEAKPYIGDFDFEKNNNQLGAVIIYAGNDGHEAVKEFGRIIKRDIAVITCDCGISEKQQTLPSTYTSMFVTNYCGAESILGAIADQILGINRSGDDRNYTDIEPKIFAQKIWDGI